VDAVETEFELDADCVMVEHVLVGDDGVVFRWSFVY